MVAQIRRPNVPHEIAIDVLKQRFGDQISTALMVRQQHGKDESYHPIEAPDAVFFARSTEDVVEAVKICAQYKVPMIPFGTGTSLEGHVAAREGGISIDVSQMNQVLRVSPEDLDCTVQPGVTRKQLNEYLRDTGLFFPIDPGADASLGGMTATRASGTNAVRYGTMRENVLSLTAVLADGRIIKTANRARKSSAGYDLTRLFVGSEGTLGVITEVTVKLYGIPEAISAAVCAFPTIGDAVNAVIATIQAGVPVARIELLDEVQIDACNRYSKLDLKVAPTLFFEFHGTAQSVREQAEMAAGFAEENGGEGFKWTATPEERAKLWEARHNSFYAALALRPGSKGWATDVCVPISHLAEAIAATKEDLATASMPVAVVGHVGDGNFHLCFVIDPNKPAEFEEAARINDRMVTRALALGGTCTGEHGVGYGKMQYLVPEHGLVAVDVMRQIKRTLDPDNLMNPGKVVAV
jgi:D-lactate dehydrogenase (cytochrome)